MANGALCYQRDGDRGLRAASIALSLAVLSIAWWASTPVSVSAGTGCLCRLQGRRRCRAAVAAPAAFLPSSVIMLAMIMLAILPVLDRVRQLAWVRAVMRGVAPAVIGVLAVSLVRLSPAALPDPFAVAILIGTSSRRRPSASAPSSSWVALGLLRSQGPVTWLTRPF